MDKNYYGGYDPVLTNVALSYTNAKYIADQIFPDVPVRFQSGKHFVYDQGRFRVTETRRGAGANSQEMTLKLTTGNNYFCEDHANKFFVTDEDMKNAITPTTPMQDATEYLMDLHLTAREKEVADMLTDTTVLTQNTTLSGSSQWDQTGSTPLEDVATGRQAIFDAVHQMPNVMILSQQAWNKLKLNAELVDRIKYTHAGAFTLEMAAALFEVDRILIGGAGYNTSAEGQADSMSPIWGKDCILAYVAPRVAPKVMSLGLNYVWQGEGHLAVERLRGVDEQDRKGTYIRVGNWYYDTNIVAANAGYLIKNCVA